MEIELTLSVQKLFELYKHQVANGGDEHYINDLKNLMMERCKYHGIMKEAMFDGCCSEYRNEARIFQHDVEVLLGMRVQGDFNNLIADSW